MVIWLSRLPGRWAGRFLHGADNRLEASLQIEVDLVGIGEVVAGRRHACGPLFGRLHHPLVLHDALVQQVQLALDLAQQLRAAEHGRDASFLQPPSLPKSPVSNASKSVAPGLSPPSVTS